MAAAAAAEEEDHLCEIDRLAPPTAHLFFQYSLLIFAQPQRRSHVYPSYVINLWECGHVW